MYSCSLSQASGMDSIPIYLKLEILPRRAFVLPSGKNFCEERLGAFGPGVDVLFFVKPLFCLPQQGEGKQMKLDNIGGDTPYDYGVEELQKVLQICIGILILLATEWASLHHVDDAGFQLEVHAPDIDVGSSSHIIGGGDGELTESLFSHSLNSKWCFRNGFVCRENSERRNDARSCPSHELL